jgi:proline dehydrogenase
MRLNFRDAQFAFRSKSTKELARALLVLKLCTFRPLVSNASSLLKNSRRILGDGLTLGLIRQTFFNHFCAGEDSTSIRPTISRLESQGIKSILDFAAEADVAEKTNSNQPLTTPGIDARSYAEDISESDCDANLQVFEQCIRAAGQFEGGFAAIKISGLGRPVLLQKLSHVVNQTRRIFLDIDKEKKRVLTFEEFSRGIESMGVVLDPSSAKDLFIRFDHGQDGTIDLLEWIEHLKVEDPATRAFFVSQGMLPSLSDEELNQFQRVVHRVEKLADLALDLKVRLMIDAEQTYFQAGIDHLVMNLQRKYNRGDIPIIFGTCQAYLRDAWPRLLTDLERARRENFRFAAKIVRGAYMIAERKRANELNYKDPIHVDLEATHACYHRCIDAMFDNISRSEVMIASHNQKSIEYVISKMNELGIDKKSGGVYFGQLLGMADHLSLILGQNGYNVFKYVPYGPVHQVLPYLVRRAEENSAILEGEGVQLEREMLWEELKRRLLPN